jgi:peptidoglycan/xylan/chitin deacetylase (PgdA/CDA1 family)
MTADRGVLKDKKGRVPVQAMTLAYHDVVENENVGDGGLRPHAAHYSLGRVTFRQHLESLEAKSSGMSVGAIDRFRRWEKDIPLFLTFDDGALGSYTCVANELEGLNWRGHFFIVSSWIGRPGFLGASQIRELRGRGHVIGSHSASHPERMANLGREELQKEWTVSCAVLSDVLGEKVRVASVPNGYYTRAVGKAAASAGIEVLFTSEPTMSARLVEGCMILGRYSLQAGDPPALAGALTRERWPRLRQALLWKAKKVVKTVGGSAYLEVRTRLLSRESHRSKPSDPA